ncbi:PepSY domain-containing protein [Streptococcus ferus]|uniref:Peptidase propeptide/YPEB domain-containing protein n=1 Tax=Streptococcus ferus TaxID=1345 RepID=A0A2X3W6I1_9STRE|nr:PepSY domain-containing protein [Streptococcus ferus]SQF39363.1 peptidase propeptide/YPEB domain-containing protein [Streptococcus ferus]
MLRKKAIVLGMSGLVVAAGVVFSVKAAQADSDLSASDISKAKISLVKASELALKEAQSGKVVAVDIDDEGSSLRYDVTVLTDKAEKDYTIDANSGEVLRSSNEKLSSTDTEEKELAKASPKISLSELQTSLTKKYSGYKVVNVDLEYKGTKLVYDVELVSDSKEIKAVVDANTGKVTKEQTVSLNQDDDRHDEDHDED